uniref:Uncharacterized protein n=1 Tax=Anguilla anguilla TaxID=7936 RepID=A0A0E9PH60_ANGAN
MVFLDEGLANTDMGPPWTIMPVAPLKLLAENYIVNWNCAAVCENVFVNGGNPKIMIDKETD